MNNLNAQAWLALIALFVVMGLLLFIPAGTVQYWQAWAYLSVYFASSFLITLYLVKKDPALLKRRMRGGPMAEKEPAQRIIMFIASFAFIAMLVVPALDYRFKWSHVPLVGVVAGDILTALCFYIMYLVLKTNPFTSSTIEISEQQKVISTGPYAVVRHPMYAGALPLFIGAPLALGSYWGLLAF